MKSLASTLGAALLCFGATQVCAGNQAWDGFVQASTAPIGNGKWLYCMEGELTIKRQQCTEDKFYRVVERAQPRELTLQQILDIKSKAPEGYRWEAVGPLPDFWGHIAAVAPRSIFIAYRVVPDRPGN